MPTRKSDTADDSLKDQITIEGFYRLQFAQNLALTAGGQLLIDPALNPETDQIWVLSLRARVTYQEASRSGPTGGTVWARRPTSDGTPW